MPAPTTPPPIEHLTLGSVTCDFLRFDTFRELCKKWLTEEQLHHIVTLNPEMVMEAQENAEFKRAIAQADIRVPDGAGLVWAQWFIRSQFWSLWPSLFAFSFRAVERITGVDTVWLLAELCAEQGRGLYLLGGTASQVQHTATKLQTKWPNLQVHTSPDHQFDPSGPASILTDIQHRQPAVLLVAYGARKQTIWIEQHRADLPSVHIAVGVGGAFAILGEEKPRAPKLLQQFNLEWLWRLALEPKRLPRIWRATIQFPLLIQRQKMAHPPTFTSVETKTQ